MQTQASIVRSTPWLLRSYAAPQQRLQRVRVHHTAALRTAQTAAGQGTTTFHHAAFGVNLFGTSTALSLPWTSHCQLPRLGACCVDLHSKTVQNTFGQCVEQNMELTEYKFNGIGIESQARNKTKYCKMKYACER